MRGRRLNPVRISRVLALSVVVGVLLWISQSPQMANHFGYALPGPRGLPSRLSYDGRSFANQFTCAGAEWCHADGPPSCTPTVQTLQPAGFVVTLFGLPYTLFRSPTPRGMTTISLYVSLAHDCYVSYTLEGGP